MSGPLQDVRVLDLTDELGAYCPKLLADLGADVIKIEPPGGHPGRFRAPFAPDGTSLWWLFYNTNKRSVTIQDQETLKRLLQTADAVVEDAAPGVYDELRKEHPHLVWTSVTPFGQDGPHACYKASDLVGQAMGGFMYRIGWPDDPPNRMGANPAYSQAGDDRWCAITVFNQEEWLFLCKATGHADWANDPRFSTLAGRKKHEDELDSCLNAWTETLPAEEAMNLLQLHGVPAGVVQHAGDLIENDPQMAARGFYQTLHHEEIGDMTVEGIPFKLLSTPGVPKRPAPLLGEHNDFVLQGVLGMSEQEVNDCIVDGAVM